MECVWVASRCQWGPPKLISDCHGGGTQQHDNHSRGEGDTRESHTKGAERAGRAWGGGGQGRAGSDGREAGQGMPQRGLSIRIFAA